MQQQPGAARPGGALKGAWIATTSQLLPFIRMKPDALGQRAMLVPVAAMLVASVNMIVLMDRQEPVGVGLWALGLLIGSALLYRRYKTTGQRAMLAPVALVGVGLAATLVSTTVAGLVITVAVFWFVYRLCGKPKPLWYLGLVALAVGAVITNFNFVSPLEGLFISGNTESLSFLQALWVGVVEETTKALPVVGAYYLGRRLLPPLREALGVFEPLDGILIACASATGFAFFETITVYGGAAVPRPLGSIAGHLAYSGFLGYAIGLAAMKPASAQRALTIGFVAAVGMHAIWDWLPEDPYVLSAAALCFYALFASAVLKARDISPSRSQLLGSVWLADTPAGGAVRPPAARPVVVPPQPAEPQPELRPRTDGGPARPLADAPGLSLRIGARVHPVARDLQLREPDVPGLTAQAHGVVADVTAHPQNPAVLGLRNLSTISWVATQGAGDAIEIAPGRSIRLQAGTRIAFGATVAEVERG